MSNEEIQLKKRYAIAALFSGILAGIFYVWLFTWKSIGVSHILFAFIFQLVSFIPLFIVEELHAIKRFSPWIFASIFLTSLSFSFIYRLNIGWMTFAFLTLPIINTLFLSATFFTETFRKLGLLSFITLPFKLLTGWFGDIFNFFRNLDFSLIKSVKLRSVVSRIFAGCVMGVIALLVFIPLLASADQVFGKYINDFFAILFKDLNFSIETFGKLIVGSGVSIYTSILFFSLWNKDSYLHELMKGNMNHKSEEVKRDWDVLSTDVFMFMINVVFVLFVIIQFTYFFGGEANVIGLNANYNYADYARKGFGELLAIGMLVYLISVLLNLKVYTATLIQKVIYRLNFLVLIVSTLIITYSAFAKLMLLQETYGFTGVRLLGFFIIGIMATLYLMLLISTLLKTPLRFISITTVVIIALSYVIVIVAPSDYVVAEVNYIRYQNTKKLDLPYLFTLQDESIPVLLDMAEDSSVPEITKTLILAHLEQKWIEISNSRSDWQSFNIVDYNNKQRMKKYFNKDVSTKYRDQAKLDLKNFIQNYSTKIVNQKYEDAYNNYWSKNSEKIDWKELNSVIPFQYEINSNLNNYDNWSIVNSNSAYFSGINYWNGMNLSLKFKYQIDSNSGFIYSDGYQEVVCRNEYLTVNIEDGNWKIINASVLTLANFKDNGEGRANYFQNTSLEDLLKTNYDNYPSYCN